MDKYGCLPCEECSHKEEESTDGAGSLLEEVVDGEEQEERNVIPQLPMGNGSTVEDHHWKHPGETVHPGSRNYLKNYGFNFLILSLQGPG